APRVRARAARAPAPAEAASAAKAADAASAARGQASATDRETAARGRASRRTTRRARRRPQPARRRLRAPGASARPRVAPWRRCYTPAASCLATAPSFPERRQQARPTESMGRRIGTMNEYEIMLMLDPELPEERQTEIIERMRAEIAEGGGTWDGHDVWGRRKLAYEID